MEGGDTEAPYLSVLKWRRELCFAKGKWKSGLNIGSFGVHSVLPSIWTLVSFSLKTNP